MVFILRLRKLFSYSYSLKKIIFKLGSTLIFPFPVLKRERRKEIRIPSHLGREKKRERAKQTLFEHLIL